MEKHKALDFLLNITKFNSKVYRKLDATLWGIWFNDYIILYNLSNAMDKKMRRIDLAEKVWLTASWVTRILLPMEKIGLITKEVNEFDARVSYVVLAPGWQRKLKEAEERLDEFLNESISKGLVKDIKKANILLVELNMKF